MKTFLILLIISVSIIVGCGTNSSTQTGVLKEPSLSMKSQEVGDLRVIETDLPFELWDSYEIKTFSVSVGSWSAAKQEFCVISATGTQLTSGDKVEIIDEAKCLNTQYSKGDGTAFRRYPVGLIQIRVISTGKEGWTWTKSVEFDKSN